MRFSKALTLLFVYLRLTGYIDWSFWLVSLPVLIDLAFIIIDKEMPRLEAWVERKKAELEKESQQP